MPIHPETDTFEGIEDVRPGLSVRWKYGAADSTGEGYLELADHFRNQAHKMSADGVKLPPEMVKAEVALDELGQ